MTPEQREIVMALYGTPDREPLASEAFLKKFGADDGASLGLQLLGDAIARHDGDDVELALAVCFRFGFSVAHLDLLHSLSFADWHRRHEDVARVLKELASPSSVEALLHLAEWVPIYLDFDDNRALATKAVWALAAIDNPVAREALERLSHSENAVVARGARRRLAD